MTETIQCAENIDGDEEKFKIIIDIKSNVNDGWDLLDNVDCLEEYPVDSVVISEEKEAFISRSSKLELIDVQKEETSSSHVTDLGSKFSKCQEMLHKLPSVPSKRPRFKSSKTEGFGFLNG